MYFYQSIQVGEVSMKEVKNDTQLVVKMPKELIEKFNEACKENSVNRSQLLRNFVKAYVEGRE